MMVHSYLRRSLFGLGLVASLATVASCRDLLAPEESLREGDPGLSIAGVLIGATTVEVTPAGPLALLPGDTVTLRGTGQSTPFQLTFTSSDSTVVSVTAAGRILALRPGTAQVLVAQRADLRAATPVHIQVGSRGPASVAIDSVASAEASAAGSLSLLRADSVAGKVLATLAFERGDAVRLEILIDSTLACSTDLPPTAPSVRVTTVEKARCTFDTARFDSISGEPRFRNAPADLTARLIGGGAEPLATSAPTRIRLANRDTIATRVVAERRAVDAAGREWLGGKLLISAFPVIYEGTDRTEAVTFRYVQPSGQQLTAVDSEAPFVTVIEAATLAGVVDDDVQVVVTSTLSGGGRGLSGVLRGVRYDALPPPPGRIAGRPWVGADVPFASFLIPDSLPDAGVGGVRVRFFAGSPSSSFAEVLRSGTPVQRGGDLAESAAAAYRVALEVCDALANCVPRDGFDFGVDLEPPAIGLNFPARVVRPTDDLRLTVSDERSGVSETPAEVLVLSYRPNVVSGPICGAGLQDLILPGKQIAGVCYAEPTGTLVPVPRIHEGYYVYRITASDRAGNLAKTIERVFLIDPLAPVITRFALPSQLVPGMDGILTADATDNIDLASVEFSLVFGASTGRVELPFNAPIPVGTPFTGTLTRVHSATGRIPYVRTLTTIGGNGRSTVTLDSARVRVRDAAGLEAQAGQPVPAALFGGTAAAADPFTAVSSVQLLASATTLCAAGCGIADTRSAALSLKIVGSAVLSAFSRLYWFIRAPDGSISRLASTSNFSVVETGTQRTYSYTFAFAPADGQLGQYSLFAVALNAAGNALRSPEVGLQLVGR